MFTLRYCWRWFGRLVFNDQLTPLPVYKAPVCAVHSTLTSVQRIAKVKHVHCVLNYIFCCAPDHLLQHCRPVPRNPAVSPNSSCNGGLQYGEQHKELFYFHSSVHHKSILINVQRDATICSLYFIFLQDHSTCFRFRPHPSSGVHKTAVPLVQVVDDWPRWSEVAARPYDLYQWL